MKKMEIHSMKGAETPQGKIRLLIFLPCTSLRGKIQTFPVKTCEADSSVAGNQNQELSTHSPDIATFLDVLSNGGPVRLQLKF